MAQALSSVYLHLVFSTKKRRTYLKDDRVRADMCSYLGGVSKQLGVAPLLIGGGVDHIHALCRFGRSITLADWVKEVKRASSVWVKKHAPELHDFAWQSGYGVFSVSVSNIETVKSYIKEQGEHHKKLTFQEEYRLLLKKHGIEWDEQYVWE